MTDSPTPTTDCPHTPPPIFVLLGDTGGWTATCRLGCGFRCGTADPDVEVPEHWTPCIPMIAAFQPPPVEPPRDEVLMLLRAIATLADVFDTEAKVPPAAYESGSRDLALSAALRLRDRFSTMAYQLAVARAHAEAGAFVAMDACVAASDMLSLAMVTPRPADQDYTTVRQALRSLLARLIIENRAAVVEPRLSAALAEVRW